MIKYIQLEENKKGKNFLKIEIKYNLGGFSYFTYQKEERGYYLHIQPVNKGGNFESFAAFTGYKMLLITCNRKSNRTEQQAEEEVKKYIPLIIERLCKENNFKIKEV